jgi:high-affinity Fe2+/Pb2+ permease
LTIQYQIEKKDIVFAYLFLASYSKARKWVWLWFFALFLWIAKDVVREIVREADSGTLLLTLLVVLVVAVILATLTFIFVAAFAGITGSFIAKPGEGKLGKHVITLNQTELIESTNSNETRLFWGGVEKIFESSGYIVILIKAGELHLVPKHAFATPQEANEFVHLAKKYHLEAGSLPT